MEKAKVGKEKSLKTMNKIKEDTVFIKNNLADCFEK